VRQTVCWSRPHGHGTRRASREVSTPHGCRSSRAALPAGWRRGACRQRGGRRRCARAVRARSPRSPTRSSQGRAARSGLWRGSTRAGDLPVRRRVGRVSRLGGVRMRVLLSRPERRGDHGDGGVGTRHHVWRRWHWLPTAALCAERCQTLVGTGPERARPRPGRCEALGRRARPQPQAPSTGPAPRWGRRP